VGRTAEKIEAAIKMFDEGKDAREVAKNLGYKDATSLGRLMNGQGYKWDKRRRNYVSMNGEDTSGVDVAAILEERGRELLALLDWYAEVKGSLPGEPRIRRFAGPTVTKGFRLPIEVDERLNEYCRRTVTHQKDVLVTAILEFLDRYDGDM